MASSRGAAEPRPRREAGHREASQPRLVVLATLILAFFAIFSIWANRQALNTDNWVHTSDRLLQNKKVDERLSAYLADQLFANVDVQAELEKALPPQLAAAGRARRRRARPAGAADRRTGAWKPAACRRSGRPPTGPPTRRC